MIYRHKTHIIAKLEVDWCQNVYLSVKKTSKISLNRDYLSSLIFSSFFNIFCSNFQDMSQTVILAYLSSVVRKG